MYEWQVGRYRRKIRKAFDSLDSKQTGKIGKEELEDSLIGLGLVDTPQEVQSWTIEF